MNGLKFSILIPTYNDDEYITRTLDSIVCQTYKNWETIIIDDGSTDTTRGKIDSYLSRNIRYIYQENADQLNALLNGSKFITGDIVVLLHSDDLLANDAVLENFSRLFTTYNEIDGLYADFIKINEDGFQNGYLKTADSMQVDLLSSILLKRGDNLIGDPFVLRKETFLSHVIPNYLYDSTIYYIDYQKHTTLNLVKTEPWYKYRVFSGNYINSSVGKYVTYSGQLRTTNKLIISGMSFSPFLFKSSIAFKAIRKFFPYLFRIRIKEEISWVFAYEYYKTWCEDLKKGDNPEILLIQIEKIIHSVGVRRKGNQAGKALVVDSFPEKEYFGKDARLFFHDWANGRIKGLYSDLLLKDYDHIAVKNGMLLTSVQNALKFHSLFYPVIENFD